ncbi:tetratricopeptide repeat protein [Leptolyngbya sp. FACHB-671]|uniref:CHAT domain-containing tetratricopeptide repeat protein n=1 Tax=Leptolyngbya sp. FACHB-671 TaxID=2692812 RepID=UPI0016869439|nr:CHAT domain-containing tetratricopeptide repeat protein [Leptolyngbya sp. FACHB-671]MBD2069516.1 tetratricopeptide repeat protein [Leptolyngbya sp. FACHB-671]
MLILLRAISLPKAIATRQLLPLILSAYSLSLPFAFFPILVVPPQVLAQTTEDRRAEADALLQRGHEQYQTSQFQAALQSLQRALGIYQDIGDRTGEKSALTGLGSTHLNLGNYSNALDYYQQSLSIAQEESDQAGEGRTLAYIALAYSNLGQPTQALDYYQQSLSIAQELGDRSIQGNILITLVGIYHHLGDYSQSLNYAQEALFLAQQTSDRAQEVRILGSIGEIHRSRGQYRQALNHHQQALAIAQEEGDEDGEGLIFNNIGAVYSNLGQYSQALHYLEQALANRREIGDRLGEGLTLNNIGEVHVILGQSAQALTYFQQALTLLQEVGSSSQTGLVLSNIGKGYTHLGQYPQALSSLRQALTLAQQTSNRAVEILALGGLGFVYNHIGQHSQALDYYQQALTITQQIGDRAGEGGLLNNIGGIYYYQGQYSQALNYYEQSLSIRRDIGDRAGEGGSLNNIANVHLALRQYPEARDDLQQALFIAQELGNRFAEATAIHNLGTAYADQEQHIQALNYYQQALSIRQELGDRSGEGITLSNIGASLFLSNRLEPAEIALSDALSVLDALLQQDLTDTDKISLFDTQVLFYGVLQQIQIAQNKIEAALETSERGRARPFVSLLSQQLQDDVTTNLPAPSISDIQQIAREQNATLIQYSVINAEIAAPAIYIWVVRPTGEISFRSTELNEENQQILTGAIDTAFGGSPVFRSDSTTISNLVSNVRPADRSASRDIEFEHNPDLASDSLLQLHQLLIEPIADLLPMNQSDRIVFIPQGGLFLVPFAALQDASGDYLIENHTISIAPSIQVLGLTQQQQNHERSPENALIVGNPVMPQIWDTQTSTEVPLASLPGAEREAEAIAQFLNTEAIIGEAATETAVTQQMPDAQIIHLATHGLLEYGIPSDSGVLDVPGAIALTPDGSDDGLLTSAEILEMDLQAELVVLSACDTGRGRITGDGVVGLSRALISAGVPSVVVSLWAVPDAPTADLMTEFYRQLQANPDKAQALRQAMLITMQQHPDPKDWAAFTLIGEAQ